MELATIIGIIGQMQRAWVSWDATDQLVIQPGIVACESNRYIIRVQPGEVDSLLSDIT